MHLGLAMGMGAQDDPRQPWLSDWGPSCTTSWKVYYRHDHARSSFAARTLQAEAGKTVGLVTGKTPTDNDQTMLVYLHQLAFLSPAEAIQHWSTGKLDAVAINETARAEFSGLPAPFGPG